MAHASTDMGMDRWRGKVAVVTGASSGIGRAIVHALARDGMRVAFCARREDRLDDLTRELLDGEPAPSAADLLVRRVDMREEAQILELFTRVREKWGGVDVLVNNAGLGHASPLVSGSTEDWREMLEVNVLGLCVATREAVADMRTRGDDGHVIHIGSMAGHRVPAGAGVYSATKFAVRALTEGLRQELRALESGIRVTAISPGYVETEFADGPLRFAFEPFAVPAARTKDLDVHGRLPVSFQVTVLKRTPTMRMPTATAPK